MSPPTAPSRAFVPDDLLPEILSLLPVKSLLRFKCVSKSWNSLISDPNFVKFHLKKSKSHNPHFTLVTLNVKGIKRESPYDSDCDEEIDHSIISYPISSFIDNPSFTLSADHHSLLEDKYCTGIAGSCNGLICLTGCSEYWLRLWNPATRTISQKFGCYRDLRGFNFEFGCDNSTDTFKVVASRYIRDRSTCDVRVLSFGDSDWRNIESFPVVPLYVNHDLLGTNAVFFNGTLNWLAIHNYNHRDDWFSQLKYLTVEQLSIVSLDLGTEKYNMYKLPRGFAELPPTEPTVDVLGDCLCFSYASNEAVFNIWQMKKFGDEESWTQFLKIRFLDLQLPYVFRDGRLDYFDIRPLFLSKDGDTLCTNIVDHAILYNWRDHRVKKSRVSVDHRVKNSDNTYSYSHPLWHLANAFVESLISIC